MDLKTPKEVELVEFSVSSEVRGESWLELGGWCCWWICRRLGEKRVRVECHDR